MRRHSGHGCVARLMRSGRSPYTSGIQGRARQGDMTIDRERLMRIFDALGQKLTRPATICVIGSSPGIVSGQPDRQSADIYIWRQRSAYDETELRRACQELGLVSQREAASENMVLVELVIDQRRPE
jgi:hypothetical protein